MEIVNGLVNHVWYYVGLAALIGLILDHFVIGKGLKAAVLFPMAVGVMWLFGNSAQIAQKWTNDVQPSAAHNCITTGPNSPIVTGENSVVVINGKTYTQGQSSDCAPASTNVSTHGVGSPVVTGAGAKVVIHTDR